MIHLARDGRELGEFTPDEVREGLRTGRFLPTDSHFTDGMDGWLPAANEALVKRGHHSVQSYVDSLAAEAVTRRACIPSHPCLRARARAIAPR